MKKYVYYAIFLCIFPDIYGMTRRTHAKNETILVQETQEKEECFICYQSLYDGQQDVVTLACSRHHEVHFLCLYAWYKRNRGVAHCPICRKAMRSENNNRLFDYVVIKKEEGQPVYGDIMKWLSSLFCQSEEEQQQYREENRTRSTWWHGAIQEP